MKLSLESKTSIEKDIEIEVEQRIKDYPIYVYVDEMRVDINYQDMAGGEIHIYTSSRLPERGSK